jgi:hypothetical protein
MEKWIEKEKQKKGIVSYFASSFQMKSIKQTNAHKTKYFFQTRKILMYIVDDMIFKVLTFLLCI